MNARTFVLIFGAAGFVAVASVPASAQVVDDFLCSTFSYKCQTPPPPPPPVLAPAEPAAPVKEVKHVSKKKNKQKQKRTPAAAAPAATAPAPAPQYFQNGQEAPK